MRNSGSYDEIRNKMNSGKMASALAELSLLSKKASHELDYLNCLIEALKKNNQPDAVLKVLEQRVRVSTEPVYLLDLLEAYYQSGRLNEALDIALQLDAVPLASETREVLAQYFIKIYLECNDFEGVQEVIYNFADVLEFSDFAIWAQGLVNVYNEQFDLALENFRKAVVMNSANDRAWVSLALLHLDRADVNLGLSNLERALDANPYNETALKCLARHISPFHSSAGRTLELIELFLSKNPHDLEMRRCRIHLLSLSNRGSEMRHEMNQLQFLTQIEIAS